MKSIPNALKTVLLNPGKALTIVKSRLSQPGVPENTSFCYVREDAELSTTIYLYNYWTENYQIERPDIAFEVIDADGAKRGTHAVTLPPNGSMHVPVKDILSHVGVATPFEGSVLASISHPNLKPGRPLQMNVDYFYHQGKRVSGVHSQWGAISTPKKEKLACFHIEIQPTMDTFVIVRNTLTEKRTTSMPSVTLFNHAGKKETRTLPMIPPLGIQRVDIRALFPGAESFLEGKPGNLEINSDTEMGRCLFYHYDRTDHSYHFNHATQNIEQLEDNAYSLADMKKMGYGPVAAGPVYVNAKQDTYLIPCVDFFNHQSEYALDVALFDEKGASVFSRENVLTVHPGTVSRISFRELTKGVLSLPFTGSFRVSYHVNEHTNLYPRTFHYIAGYSTQGKSTEVQFDSGLFNMPTHNVSGEYQTTKIFSRIIVNSEFKTTINLVNPSGETGYANSSNTHVMVFDGEGKTVGEKTLVIPPNAGMHIPLETLFPTLERDLAATQGRGTVKVRDKTTRLSGFHFIRDQDDVFTGSDHLFGG